MMPSLLDSGLPLTHGLRVLVVDDQEDVAELICLLVERWGCACKSAQTGSEAIEIARSFKPAIVLLDIGLPDIIGYEVARAIRALPEGDRVYLAAVTGWGKEVDRIRAFAAGFDSHLLKPATSISLRSVVEAAARRAERTNLSDVR